jgi:DUF1680 family protein
MHGWTIAALIGASLATAGVWTESTSVASHPGEAPSWVERFWGSLLNEDGCTGVVDASPAAPADSASPQAPRLALRPFAYSDVQVTGGPMAVQERAARKFYLNLNEDSLLQGFRLRAGLPAPGKPMGGWYDPDGFAGAHSFGQYVSALSRMYANTGDRRYKDKVDRLVRGFHETMGPDGYFYASAKAAADWPCYIYDKNATGMRDAFTLAGNKEALEVLDRMTDWADKNMPRRSDEWYTLPENLYKCYALTKEPRYLKMAAEYDYSKDYYDEFAAGDNAFAEKDRQAYSHVNTLLSAAQAYESLRDEKYLRAIKNAWGYLTETQMYASGGWGPNERFVSSGGLGDSIKPGASGKNFETGCGTYANINLDRRLLGDTGDSKYGDNMERVLLNGILAALAPKPDGRTFYYSDYRAGARKEYHPDLWPCCSGTYAEITADYALDLYFQDDSGVYVNLFAPSRVHWSAGGRSVMIEQKTDFPLSGSTELIIHGREPARFALNVRVPAWSAEAPRVSINGRIEGEPIRSGSFLRVVRTWKEGDVLKVSFPMALHFETIDAKTPDRAALMYGPLLLAALSPKDIDLIGDPAKPDRWIKRSPDGDFDFRTADGVVFRPFYLIRGERYVVYPHLVRSPH